MVLAISTLKPTKNGGYHNDDDDDNDNDVDNTDAIYH